MIQTSLFMRLGEEVVCWNVAYKLQRCYEGEEGEDGDRRPVHTYFGNRFVTVYLVCLLMKRGGQSLACSPPGPAIPPINPSITFPFYFMQSCFLSLTLYLHVKNKPIRKLYQSVVAHNNISNASIIQRHTAKL